MIIPRRGSLELTRLRPPAPASSHLGGLDQRPRGGCPEARRALRHGGCHPRLGRVRGHVGGGARPGQGRGGSGVRRFHRGRGFVCRGVPGRAHPGGAAGGLRAGGGRRWGRCGPGALCPRLAPRRRRGCARRRIARRPQHLRATMTPSCLCTTRRWTVLPCRRISGTGRSRRSRMSMRKGQRGGSSGRGVKHDEAARGGGNVAADDATSSCWEAPSAAA